MVLSLQVPDNYGWVLLTGAGTGWLTMWQSLLVGRRRKAAKVAYPQVYAEVTEVKASKDALKFNCAQRAHANTLEQLPQLLFFLLFSGLKYPTAAASLGGVWLVGRVVYTLGYITGDPAKRNRGAFQAFAGLGLQLLGTYTAAMLAYSSL